jgi:RHH-type proline utilization regulon transcriptional repressor/proline dehydrogenase/delta 1-pyrroline-5-carboxylate dehydrogenase
VASPARPKPRRRSAAAWPTTWTPGAPLIAETGGLNAMIVDSTALPGTGGARHPRLQLPVGGQRCSALRCLYVQEDVAETVTEMLFGAMEELRWAIPGACHRCRPGDRRRGAGGIRRPCREARAEGPCC